MTEGTAAGARSAAGPEAAPDTADARARAVAAPAPKPDAAGTAGASAKTTAPRFDEVARFAAPRFAPGGLAYDAVSGRFVVGNLPERKLTIVAQGTNRAATLAGDAARLRGVRALEIDRRTGDLWVVSGGTDAGAIGSSELHKLQLVSGRVLSVYSAPAELGASRLVDVAVGRGIGVLALDAEGPRLLRPGSDGKALARAIDLPAGRVNSLAPADDGRHVYVAYDDRLVVVDLSARAVSPVKGNAASELRGIDRLRWQRGSLLALTTVNGTVRLIRLRLGKNGGRIASIDTLDSIAAGDAPLALDVLDDEVYYLVPGTPEAVIRRIQLK